MPQFELNADRYGKHPFYRLDAFARGYVEAMFFTNGDCGGDDEFKLNRLGVERLTRAAVADIARDCEKFLGTILPDGCFVRQWLDRLPNYEDAQAGRDFWFTRQGHGVGFWDRRELDEDTAQALTALAHEFGEAYCETYRGWIYHR